MRRSTDRILTTHVGSLVRPPELLHASAAAAGSADAREHYLTVLARATTEVVAAQAQAGIDVVNDGEYGKSSWANYVLERLTGFEPRPDTRFEAVWLGRDRVRFREFMEAEFPRGAFGVPGHACVGEIRYAGTDSITQNIGDLKSALRGANVVEGFLTAVAPASTGYDALNEHYRDEREYVFAIARALREEYLADLPVGADPAGRRRRARQHVRRADAAEPVTLPRVGRAAGRGAEHGAGRHPRGSHPLPRLLRQLARAARGGRAARRDRGPGAARARRRLLDRGRQRHATSTSGASGRT